MSHLREVEVQKSLPTESEVENSIQNNDIENVKESSSEVKKDEQLQLPPPEPSNSLNVGSLIPQLESEKDENSLEQTLDSLLSNLD